MNPFNLFNFDFDEMPVVITIVVALGLAVLIYRPFCQFICPFGLISWVAERLSLARVQIDTNRCNQCGACIRACPLDAAKHKGRWQAVRGGLLQLRPLPERLPSRGDCLSLGFGKQRSGRRHRRVRSRQGATPGSCMKLSPGDSLILLAIPQRTVSQERDASPNLEPCFIPTPSGTRSRRRVHLGSFSPVIVELRPVDY